MAKEIGNWGKTAQPRTSGATRTAADLIRGRLQPGEKLLWSARALGRADPVKGFAAADLMFAAFSAFGGILAAIIEPLRLVLFCVSAGLALVVFIRAGLMFLPKVYALTNRRVVIFHRFIPFEDSIVANAIEMISVRETRAGFGDIALRNTRPDELRLAINLPGAELIGVENPRHAAELIRATLAPTLEVTTT